MTPMREEISATAIARAVAARWSRQALAGAAATVGAVIGLLVLVPLAVSVGCLWCAAWIYDGIEDDHC